MKKIFFGICLFLLNLTSCNAQNFTTVTGTLTDSTAQVWASATVIASLRPAPNNPGLPLNNGHAITDSPQTVITDGSGHFSLVLDDTKFITPAGALWCFTIYPNATVNNGSSICLPVTGTSVDYSGQLSSILITPQVNAAPAINRAYSNSEVSGGTGGLYWDTTLNILKGCVFSGGVCSWQTIGNLGIPGASGYIMFNNGSGGLAASANLTFNNSTNMFSTPNITAASTIITPTLGPSVSQQHTLPTVTSDTFALLSASQTFNNKTYNNPTITGSLASNGAAVFSGNITSSGGNIGGIGITGSSFINGNAFLLNGAQTVNYVCSAGGSGCAGTPGDWTSSNSTSLQAIPGLVLVFPNNMPAQSVPFSCHILYAQTVGTSSDAFGIQASITPTNIEAAGFIQTNTTVFTSGNLPVLANTSASNIATFTPSAITTIWMAELHGFIETPNNAAPQNVQIMVSQSTGADLIIIKRGSFCKIY